MARKGTVALKPDITKPTLCVVAAAVAAAAAALLTAGVAAAASPDVSGKTFSQAQAALKQAGYTAVVATAFGDKTAKGNCKVIGQHDLAGGPPASWVTSATVTGVFVGGDQPTLYPGPGFGDMPTTGRVMLTLACYSAGDAGAAHPTGTGDVNTKNAH
jgi:hypothetical protein